MKVLETRLTSDGFKRRRYDNKTTTIEIPLDLFRKLNRQGGKGPRHEGWIREQQRVAKMRRAWELLEQGVPMKVVSIDLKVPFTTLRGWRDKMKGQPNGNQGNPRSL